MFITQSYIKFSAGAVLLEAHWKHGSYKNGPK